MLALLEFGVVAQQREDFFVRLGRSTGLRSKPIHVCKLLVLPPFLFAALPRSTPSQPSVAGPARQVKIIVKPEYSALAKRLNLIGAVKVEVQVSPDGRVRKAQVLGGHPVLAVVAEKAALLTEFEPAPKETTQVLEFHFGSLN